MAFAEFLIQDSSLIRNTGNIQQSYCIIVIMYKDSCVGYYWKKKKFFFLTKVSSCGFTGEPKPISTEGDSSDNNLTDNSGIGDGVESYKGKSKLTTNPKTSLYDFIIKKGVDPIQEK